MSLGGMGSYRGRGSGRRVRWVSSRLGLKLLLSIEGEGLEESLVPLCVSTVGISDGVAVSL
jgi:hypothetical protein